MTNKSCLSWVKETCFGGTAMPISQPATVLLGETKPVLIMTGMTLISEVLLADGSCQQTLSNGWYCETYPVSMKRHFEWGKTYTIERSW